MEQKTCCPNCTPVILNNSELYEYVFFKMPELIQTKEPPNNILDRIIYNYMLDIEEPINIEELIGILSKNDRIAYYYTPAILFILEKRYDKYFQKKEI